MADEKDYEVSVKVVDRRRWRENGEVNPAAAPQTSLKPTYVEELEQKLAQLEQRSIGLSIHIKCERWAGVGRCSRSRRQAPA